MRVYISTGQHEGNCRICVMEYAGYTSPDWVQYLTCTRWICGHYNGGELIQVLSADDVNIYQMTIL